MNTGIVVAFVLPGGYTYSTHLRTSFVYVVVFVCVMIVSSLFEIDSGSK